MIEFAIEIPGSPVILKPERPVQEEVVVVEHVGTLLALGVSLEKSAKLVLPVRAPWEPALDDVGQATASVDQARVDVEAVVFLGNRLSMVEYPSSFHTRSMRSSESARSITVKLGCIPHAMP